MLKIELDASARQLKFKSLRCYFPRPLPFLENQTSNSMMATSIKIGQRIEGKIAIYLVSTQIAKHIWTATSDHLHPALILIS